VVAITAGASTPDRETAEVVRRLLELDAVSCADDTRKRNACE
jgi:4-hydroxy-3-methylbut-2-enyl diphosphate reductase IspH